MARAFAGVAEPAPVAAQVPALAAARDALAAALAGDDPAPRTTYGLVHGELGPDHLLLDDDVLRRRPT